jgi:hypothetical protein
LFNICAECLADNNAQDRLLVAVAIHQGLKWQCALVAGRRRDHGLAYLHLTPRSLTNMLIVCGDGTLYATVDIVNFSGTQGVRQPVVIRQSRASRDAQHPVGGDCV